MRVARSRRIALRVGLAAAGVAALAVATAYVAMGAGYVRSPYSSPAARAFARSLGLGERAYNLGEVSPGSAYRSSAPDAWLLRHLHRDRSLRRVVSLAGPFEAHETARALGMDVRVYDWDGHHLPPRRELDEVLDAIDAGGPMLLHCKHGRDRAGYAVAAYRILRQGWDAERALREMESYGYDADDPDHAEVQRALRALAPRD